MLNDNSQVGIREYEKIATAVDGELAKTRERLVRLVGEHWTGTAEGPTSPYMVYRGVVYEAEPISG
ncbi:hypothetical protein MSS2_03464 [Mycobacterium marinum]|nr:hypothetical protein MSS2_03464 [Mycobacterium marinum]